MAHFAAPGGTKTSNFANRIGREVVVEHEVLVAQAFQPVDHLLGVLGAQRGGADRLRFTAREQRRTVRARQEADHRFDRADLRGGAPVDPLAVLEDGGADDIGLDLLHRLHRDHLGLRAFSGKRGLGLGPGFVQRVGAGRLVGQLVGRGNILADEVLELLLDVGGVVAEIDLPGFLGGLLGQLDDRADHLAAFVVREQHGAEHLVLGQFLGFRFHHHHGGVGGGDGQVEPARRERNVLLRVEHVFAIDEADARGGDRAHERHARDGQRGRGSDHRDDIGFSLAVIAQNLGDDVDFVVETFGEQRADRTVDQAGNQRFLFRRAALTLEEATRDAPGGRILFLVVHGEREEILPVLHRLGGGDRAKHNGFAISGKDRAVSLTGNAAGFEGEGLSAPLQRYGFDVEHDVSFNPRAQLPAGFAAGEYRPGPVRGTGLAPRAPAELRESPVLEHGARGTSSIPCPPRP